MADRTYTYASTDSEMTELSRRRHLSVLLARCAKIDAERRQIEEEIALIGKGLEDSKKSFGSLSDS